MGRHILLFLIEVDYFLLVLSFEAVIKKLFCQFASQSSEVDITQPILQFTLLRFNLFYCYIFVSVHNMNALARHKYKAARIEIVVLLEMLKQD